MKYPWGRPGGHRRAAPSVAVDRVRAPISRPILTYPVAMSRWDHGKGRTLDHSTSGHQAVQLLQGNGGEATNAQRARRLAELSDRMDTPHKFHKGQIVRWKPGLRNKATPANNEVAIVREVLETPVFDACEQSLCAGSPYFGEPLTLVLAILDPEGDFLEYRYDGRRFEPAEA